MINPDLPEGTRLGPYEIVRKLGSGGMGTVYESRDSRLGRNVALKVLSIATDQSRLERFEREARATAVLAHPNIVTIFDIGRYQGQPYLVYEFVGGQTLRRYLKSHKLKESEALTFAVQLVRGVSAAHALKIIHRDLKPENVMVTGNGTLKILDFGLAKLMPESGVAAHDVDDLSTREGHILGTPAYMSPEQARGEMIDARSDLFSVGSVIYELLAGKSPFLRQTSVQSMSAVIGDPIPPLDKSLGVSSSLEKIVNRCLNKNAADRFQTAQDLLFALEAQAPEIALKTHAVELDTPDDEPTSIAVLPFADMSPSHDQDYFCQGLAEELINSLTHIDNLQVASRSSSFQFNTAGLDIRAVGARLGVATVLEGSVRKAGNRVRITVQLIDVADGYHRWSQRYDRDLEDIFAIQDEIAESVAQELRGILTPGELKGLRRPGTVAAAYEEFLKGRQAYARSTSESLDEAGVFYEKAIAIDPSYAPAYAGLADVHSWRYQWWGQQDSDYKIADDASRKALELAPELDQAHISRAFLLSLKGHYDEAAASFEEAIHLNPNSADAYYLYARSEFAAGRTAKAAELFRRASEIDQDDFEASALLPMTLEKIGRTGEVEDALREAASRAERRLELDPNDVRVLSLGASVLAHLGRKSEAISWSNRALQISPHELSPLLNRACLHARDGEVDDAIRFLERVFKEGHVHRDWIENDPDYDSLRDDPRFIKLMQGLE